MNSLSTLVLGLTLSLASLAHAAKDYPPLPVPPAVSHDSRSDSRSGKTAPLSLEGTWEVESRSCYSGAPLLDRYVPGRDTIEMSFHNGRFRSFSDIEGCVFYGAGDYIERGQYLELIVQKQVSTCSNVRGGGREVYRYQLGPDQLSFAFGPIGYGGACPQGDYMAITYRRF